MPSAKAPTFIPAEFLNSNYLRFWISPDVAIAMGITVLAPGDKLAGQSAEMIANSQPGVQEIDAYECVLGDAMGGDAPYLPGKTMWKKHGELSVHCCKRPHSSILTIQAAGVRVKLRESDAAWRLAESAIVRHETSAVAGQAA